MKETSSMNLGVFNRVNLKDNTDGGGMYSEWASLSPLIQQQQAAGGGGHSVLDKFGGGVGREVVLGVVRQLASNLGLTQPPEPSPLTTDQEVLWCMEVVCYGLSLPLTEHDTIKDCVNVYCEWLSALLPQPKLCVPQPLLNDPNLYARKIIQHFHNLFVPRKGQGVDVINRQAVLCHRVLRTLQQLASDSEVLNKETWDVLLLFLLAINDTLLSPPEVRDDVADQLCERVLSVLLDTWLVACARGCFPAPPLWRSLRQCCMQWRHRPPLVDQWNRACLALTARLLRFTHGPRHAAPALLDLEELLPPGMTDDCCAQAWYRLLHSIGNPAHLARPQLVSRTDKFLQLAMEQDQDPTDHPCLQHLPGIFLRAMRGVATHVDAFLGTWGCSGAVHVDRTSHGDEPGVRTSAEAPVAPTNTPTPPPHRRLAKSFSVAPTSSLSSSSNNTSLKGIQKASLIGVTSRALGSTQPSSMSSSGPPSSTSSITSTTSLGGWSGGGWGEIRGSLAPGRPRCNSILHLFGEWLFEAAFIGTDLLGIKGANTEDGTGSTIHMGDYEGGRAEALGALCRIFCAKKTGEEILPVYLARFYVAVRCALKHPQSTAGGSLPASLCSVLLNSGELFRVELDGVQTLVPSVVTALEMVLPDKDLQVPLHVSRIELRRASIHLLMSLVALPLHFHNLPIRDLPGSRTESIVTFASLKPRLMNLVMSALQVETDAHNTHMLLGCLLACVQDSAALEQVDHSPSQQDSADNHTSNLLSSVSDTCSLSSGGGIQFRSSGSERSSTPYEDVSPSFNPTTPPDSAHALFVRATYLVCHRLISTWKSDLNVSLGALELLSGLARIHIRESDALECKRAVKWTCDYIVSQCSRPPPAHSKDLHSTIVAAYQCLGTWLLEHPYLLHGPDSRDCLDTVLETVELGVSGAKSGRARLKDDKEPKPASMRVRDAAECLLTQLLEHVGHFPGECGAESLSSLLDEQALIGQCSNGSTHASGKTPRATDRFRYFILEGAAVLLALLEEPLGNDQDPQPTVTLILRGPFGRHAWTMQLRHLPRHRQGLTVAGGSTRCVSGGGPRPVAMRDAPQRTEHRHRYFPDSVERVPRCLIDDCIPSTERVSQSEAEDVDTLAKLIQRQVVSEKHLGESGSAEVPECSPPPVCHDYQTARLFLSHWGFLNNAGSLVALDTAAGGPEFERDLHQLDAMCARTCDTVHLVYVRAGQTRVHDIVRNALHESTVAPEFLDFLLTLGWPVLVSQHHGWTGHVVTSWRVTSDEMTSGNDIDDTPPDHGGCLFDGRNQVLYWADTMSEVAFVVPSGLSGNRYKQDDLNVPSEQAGSTSTTYSPYSHTSWYGGGNAQPGEKPRALSLDLERGNTSTVTVGGSSGSTRRSGARPQPQPDTRIVVAWLESYEDHLTFPVEELVREHTDSGLATNASGPRLPPCTVLIYLHLMQSGLVRVRVQHHSTSTGRGAQLATPLVDGAVVSRRSLGPLVRQTAINVSRRRRLDSDSYQPPHVRRRLKLQDILHKYKRDLTIPELLTYLFTTP